MLPERWLLLIAGGLICLLSAMCGRVSLKSRLRLAFGVLSGSGAVMGFSGMDERSTELQGFLYWFTGGCAPITGLVLFGVTLGLLRAVGHWLEQRASKRRKPADGRAF